MSDVNIDKLQIEVEASAEKAESNLDKLIKKLQNFSETIRKTTGLDRISKQIDKINASVSKITGTAKLEKLTETVNKLKNMQSPNVTKTVNAIKKLAEASNSIGSISGTERLASNIQAISEACKPMENMGKNTLAPFLNSLKKIPEITEKLDTSTIKEFADRIRSLTAALRPLTTEVQKSEKGLASLNDIVKSTTASNGNLASSNAAATRSFTSLRGMLNSVKIKLAAYVLIGHKVGSVMSEWLTSSNDYVENLNLFTVSMGDAAQSALEYAQTVNDLLGIDVSEWIRNQGVFKQITSGFGVATEKANLMSKNLTQIGYDIASFFNIDIEDAMQKVQSGISGEIEPLRRLGITLDAATLQQVAYNNGITQNINTMTQAQKSQLRYIAILQQSTNVMGDMARTVATPANSMRILGQQIEQLKRAFGNIVSVVAAKVIPYIQVAVRLLTDLGNYLADKLGFELPKIDYSGVSDGISSVTDSAEEATEAVSETVKELNWLAGFDEITKIPSADKDSSGSDNALNNFDLGIDLPEYDFLKDLDSQTDDLYKQVKKQLQDLYKWWQKHKTIIKTIAGLIAGLWVVNKVKKFIGFIGDLWQGFKDLSIIKDVRKMLGDFLDGFKKSKATTFLGKLKDGFAGVRSQLSLIQKIGIGAVFGTIGGIASYDFFKKLSDKTLTWKDALKDTVISLGSIAAAFAIGGPIAGGVAIVVTALTGLVTWLKTSDEKAKEMQKTLSDAELYDNGGLKIDTFTQKLKDLYDPLLESTSKIQDMQTQIDGIKTNIDNSCGSLDLFVQKTANGVQPTAENVGKIKKEFDGLIQNMKNNLEIETDLIYEAFYQSGKTAAENLGLNVDDMTIILESFKSTFTTKTDELQEVANGYFEKMMSGVSLTAEEQQDFIHKIEYAAELSRDLDDAQIDLQNSISDISKIDFENESAALDKINEIKSYGQELLSSVDEASTTAQKTIENFKHKAEVMFENGDLDKATYNNYIKYFNNLSKSIKSGYDEQKSDIEADLESIYGAIKNQLISANDKAVQELMSKEDYGLSPMQLAVYNFRTKFKGEDITIEGYIREEVVKQYDTLYDAIDQCTSDLDIKADLLGGETLMERIVNEEEKVLPSQVKKIQQQQEKLVEGVREILNPRISKTAGVNFGFGFSDGISSQPVTVRTTTAINKYGLDALSTFMNSLDEHSPSKKTQEIGIYFSQGFINGISFQKPFMLATIVLTARAAVSTFSDNIDVTSAGEKFAETFIRGIRENKAGIVNEIVDMFNEILDRTDTFNVKLMDTFNSAIPQFQSMGDTLASLAGSASMRINGISYTAPGYRLQYDSNYASGGFPKKHQLFIARENGIPEMVGRIGSQTAVANNDQITEAIFKAVYRAMSESGNSNSSGSDGDTYVFIDSDEIAARIERRQNTRNKRTGGRV